MFDVIVNLEIGNVFRILVCFFFVNLMMLMLVWILSWLIVGIGILVVNVIMFRRLFCNWLLRLV